MKNKVKLCFLSKDSKYLSSFISRVKLLWRIVTSNELRPLPSSIAYYLILSIFPLMALLGYISSLFNLSISDVTNVFNESNIGLSTFLGSIINLESVPLDTAFYTIMALVLASNGAYSIVIAANELYQIKDNNIILRRVKAFFIIILLLLIFIFTMIFLAFSSTIFNFIIDHTVFGPTINRIFPYFMFLKWPFAFLLIFFCIKLIYVIAPDKKIASSTVNKGALFTTIGWIITTLVYAFYVNNVANYNLFYGSLSDVIVLFIWTYFISYIFVVGIAINTNNYHLDKKV